MPTATLTSESRTYFPELDGVRALAIVMVMIFHMAQDLRRSPGLFVLGQTGVDLFFVLSGLLITGILLRAPSADWHQVRTFYIRRTLRIFPLYYGYLILLALTGSHVSPTFWFYVQNIYLSFHDSIMGPTHFWSLAVEEQFYLVWPFLVLFLPRRHLKATLLLSMAAACSAGFRSSTFT